METAISEKKNLKPKFAIPGKIGQQVQPRGTDRGNKPHFTQNAQSLFRGKFRFPKEIMVYALALNDHKPLNVVQSDSRPLSTQSTFWAS